MGKTRVSVSHFMGCCGPLKRKYNSWDEVWDSSDYDLFVCEKCGKTDFGEGFEQMVLDTEILECPHCKKETKHELEYFDWFSGYTETTCTNCKKKVNHEPNHEECEEV